MHSSPLFVFDAYGTLFDVHSAVARHAARLGSKADAVSRLWRAKQLEYSWVLSLAGRHRDFWVLTAEALDFALAAEAVDPGPMRADLLDAYLALDAYPEVPEVLDGLRAAGARTAILSNGAPGMLEAAIASAGLDGRLDAVISVEEAGIFKPDARVYDLACRRFGAAPAEVMFQSSNAWDVAGAAAFGYRCHWINRAGAPAEYPGLGPAATLPDLRPLLSMVASR
jgi:2-haloacid dehalogenase